MTVDGDVVAGGELVGGGGLDEEEGVLDLGECEGGVMRQSADVVPSVVIVVAVTPERSVLAEVPAVLLRGDGLVDSVHSLQDLAPDLVVEAELAGVADAVDLHVVDALQGSKARPAGHGVAVHLGHPALAGVGCVHGRPAHRQEDQEKILLSVKYLILSSHSWLEC